MTRIPIERRSLTQSLRTSIGFCICVAIVAMVSGPIAVSAQESLSPERRGESLLLEKCSSCHAVGVTGASPHDKAPPFRTLSERYPIESLEEGLAEGLVSGHPDMPEFVFAPQDVGAIIRYLESIQKR